MDQAIKTRGLRCKACGSPRLTIHPELLDLSIAHMDCDAFYASVEKRDNPELRNKPVIIGGGKRGVVSTACYIARIHGVHSAMPMFKALEKCPEAIVIRPRISVYSEVSQSIREMMEALTPAIEPLSLDEAFIDLTGTARLHGKPPAYMLAKLILDMERELGISGSIGLSHNKFLAKLASDLEKPRGFSVIGVSETETKLADLPVKKIWGAGKVLQKQLHSLGIDTFKDIRRFGKDGLTAKFGAMGHRLYHLSKGEDQRIVTRRAPVKSISKETTFFDDIDDYDALVGWLWRLAEQVSDRAKDKRYAGLTVTLKLKKADFKTLSRRVTLNEPTQMAERIFASAEPLLKAEQDNGPFRLLGVGISNLVSPEGADQFLDMLESDMRQNAQTERATDMIRRKFGKDAILKGRALK